MRDLNDEINKLIREKGHWEDRILELGGPDYRVGSLWLFKITDPHPNIPLLQCFNCIFNFIALLQRIGPKMLDYEGKEVPGNRGYK